VLGAGPGLGAAVARRFGKAGYDVALVSRAPDSLEELGRNLQSDGITTGWTPLDLTDEAALTEAIHRFGEHSGQIDHLHFNPSAFTPKNPLELTVAELLADVALGVGSLLTAVQAARPYLRAGSRITATGSLSAEQPWAGAASLGVEKAGLRNLVKSIDATLAPDGIRAVTVTVAGTIKPDSSFDPNHIADTIFEAAETDEEFWADEVRFTGRD
jgi:NAD(P)-dependent dehydrogenase (short-subunit alcohol dehydrogenase family)